MSHLDDDRDEMRRHRIPDAAAEALLAGRVPADGEDLAPLAELIGEVRTLGDGPMPAPSAALAAVLSDGLAPAELARTDNGDRSAMAGSNAHGPAARQVAGLPKWRRTPAMLSTLFAWIAGLSTAGKAAVALTTASALAAGGAAVDLPQAVSDAFERRGQEEVVEDDGTELEALVVDDEGLDEDEWTEEEGRPEDNPATERSAEGRAKALENTADTPARVPTTVGPGTGEAQRDDVGRPETVPAAPQAEGRAPESVPAPPAEDRGAPESVPAPPAEDRGAPESVPAPAPQAEGRTPQSAPPAPGGPVQDGADEEDAEEAGATSAKPEGTPGPGRP
jgi:hypothetical protein